MEYYEVLFTQTTTDGKELLTISTGEGTGDVETITTTNVPNSAKWEYISLKDRSITKVVCIY